MEHADQKTPAIFVFEGTTPAHSIFNPNEWSNDSKAVIASCSAQFALLLFASTALATAHEGVAQICAQRVAELQRQWRASRWDLQRLRYFVEVPSVHLSIQAFLVTVKTLLDLMAQLLSTERVVHTRLHGFHKKGRVVGGEVLYALAHKRNPLRGEAAARIREYLTEQKSVWIDEVVEARDCLAHPTRGAPQVMWELEVKAEDGSLACERIVPPHIGEQAFDRYAASVAGLCEVFATKILADVRTA